MPKTKLTKPWQPGFDTEADATKAGRKFYERTDGTLSVEGRDFHVVQVTSGRWYFKDGPAVEAGRAALA